MTLLLFRKIAAGALSAVSLFFLLAHLFLSDVPAAAEEGDLQPPDRKYLYLEDKYKKRTGRLKKKQIQAKRRSAQKALMSGTLPFDVNATTIGFDSSGNVINAEGDVIITYGAIVAEAEHGQVDIRNNQANLSGDVRITDVTGNLTADAANINLNDGSGSMHNADIYFVDGDYQLKAKEAQREEGDSYVLKDALLSTCQCPSASDCMPWNLHARDARITRNGYGQAWNTTLDVRGIPVFYFPYLIFPAKNERQSGFLSPNFGGGRERGIDLDIPFFWAIDNSSDMTITGVYESKIHTGVDTEYRKIFSLNNRLNMGLIYLDESQRGNNLYGTNVEGIYDPEFDKHRFGGYLNQNWRIPVGSQRVQYLVDGRYVSDNLFAREYERDEIAERNDRFVTSTAVLRSSLGEAWSADLSGEYNQSLISNQDLVFQRTPEFNIGGLNSFNPLGENPLGLKLLTQSNISSIYFTRTTGYDGQRSEAYQRLQMPFHFRNFFDGSIEGNVRASQYNLTDTHVPSEDSDGTAIETEEELPGSSDRVVPGAVGRLSTAVEKVFDVDNENPIKWMAELGGIGREQQLVRLKHTIEPGLKYQFVPEVDQSENPQFDAYDRLAQRNVVTYGVTQRLYGRYEPRNPYLYGIEEVTPELNDLGSVRTTVPLDERFTFGFEEDAYTGELRSVRKGSIAELATFKLSQSYNILEADSSDPDNSALSDVNANLTLFPNDHVALRADTDYDAENDEFSAYTLETQLSSKRGDSLRSRYRFIESQVEQLESSLEVRMTEFIKVGYYTRYDQLTGTFIEQKGGLRFSSACRCWLFDIQVSDQVNPNETKLSFNITLLGLGEFGNTFFKAMKDNPAAAQ